MKALIKKSLQRHDVHVMQVPVPPLEPGSVLVQTEACGICGSDVHAWRQDPGYEWVRAPVALGHEAVGHVIEVADETNRSWRGKRVVPLSIDGCGLCPTCLRGKPQLCHEGSVLGITFGGGAAEMFAIPATRLVQVPEEVGATTLALIEPLSVACHAIALLDPSEKFDGEIVVSGPGTIGMLIALVLKRRGAHVVITGAQQDKTTRLPLAASLGLEPRVAGEDILPHHPVTWFEASGAGSALNNACQTVMPGGTVIAVGLFGAPAGLDMNVVVRRQIRLQGSYASTRTDYNEALALICEDPLLWSSLVTRFPLDEGVAALEKTAAAQVIKAVLVP